MQRTNQQSRSLHKYFELLAKELNSAGYDVGATIKIPVDFTKDTVKEYMAKPILRALWPDKEGTHELTTTEIGELYEEMNRLTSDKFGIGIDLPSESSLYNESQQRFNKPLKN